MVNSDDIHMFCTKCGKKITHQEDYEFEGKCTECYDKEK